MGSSGDPSSEPVYQSTSARARDTSDSQTEPVVADSTGSSRALNAQTDNREAGTNSGGEPNAASERDRQDGFDRGPWSVWQ